MEKEQLRINIEDGLKETPAYGPIYDQNGWDIQEFNMPVNKAYWQDIQDYFKRQDPVAELLDDDDPNEGAIRQFFGRQ